MTLKMIYVTGRSIHVYVREWVCRSVSGLCNNAACVYLGDLTDKFRMAGDWELSLWVAQLE